MKNNKGFTLVELIAIIVILLALSLFVLSFVSKKIEENSKNAFIEEANTFVKGAMTKQEFDKLENILSDDSFHGQVEGKKCYSITLDILNKYVEKDPGKYHGSVEICYSDDCEYNAKIWITDGKYYIDGLTSVTNKDQITDSFTTDYPDTCGVRAIGSGTDGDLTTALFDYNGHEEKMDILIDGVYSFEVWGAQGGDVISSIYYGGYGAYSYGEVNLKKGDKLYIRVGQQGSLNCPSVDDCYSAFNGGGRGGKYISGGGGATSIALKPGPIGSLTENNLLIVAGGGGGASGGGGDCAFYGAHAGGYSTYVPTGSCYGDAAYSGRFGIYGGIPSNNTGYRGAGGGYGSGSYNYGYGSGPAKYGWGRIGGGTGFIANPKLKNGVMYCYNCGNNTTASTKTVQLPEVSEEPISTYSKMGNGYAIIRYIGDFTQS